MFRDRGREGERKGEKHPCVVASHVPVTQACALTGNRTGDPLLRSLGLNPLSHTSQGKYMYFLMKRMSQEGLLFVVSRTRAENQMETCGVHLDGTLFLPAQG